MLHATETNLQRCALQASCPSLHAPSMGAEPRKEDLSQASCAWEKNRCSSLFQAVIRVATIPRQGKEGGDNCPQFPCLISFLGCEVPEVFQRKERSIVPAQCHSVWSQGSSATALVLGPAQLEGNGLSAAWAVLAPGPLPGGKLWDMGASCQDSLRAGSHSPWPGVARPGLATLLLGPWGGPGLCLTLTCVPRLCHLPPC